MIHLASWAIVLVAVSAPTSASDRTNCALAGPQFPKPAALHQLADIRQTAASFADILSEAIHTGHSPWGTVDRVDTTFSIGVFSTSTDAFLFEHHHTGDSLHETLTGGALDRDTLYRIGSVTKLLTVYTILVKLGPDYWNEPITKFIPELEQSTATEDQNAVRTVKWSEVTLGALASQLSGIARDSQF
jgi:hypothetical protein